MIRLPLYRELTAEERRQFRFDIGPGTFLLAMAIAFLILAYTTPVPGA